MLGHDNDGLTVDVDFNFLRRETLDVDHQLEVVVLHFRHGSRLGQGILLNLNQISQIL